MANSFAQNDAVISRPQDQTLVSLSATPSRTPSPVSFPWPLQKKRSQRPYRSSISRKLCDHGLPVYSSSDIECVRDIAQRKQLQRECPRCQHCRCEYCEESSQNAFDLSKLAPIQSRNALRGNGSSYPQGVHRRAKLRSKRPRSLSRNSAMSRDSLSAPASGISVRTSDASHSGYSASPTPSVSSFTSQSTSLASGNGSGSGSGNASSGGTPDGHWMNWDPIAQELQQRLAKIKDERLQVVKHLEGIEQRIETLKSKLATKERQEKEEEEKVGVGQVKDNEMDDRHRLLLGNMEDI